MFNRLIDNRFVGFRLVKESIKTMSRHLKYPFPRTDYYNLSRYSTRLPKLRRSLSVLIPNKRV